jgi:hypothetical protein
MVRVIAVIAGVGRLDDALGCGALPAAFFAAFELRALQASICGTTSGGNGGTA